GSAIPLAAALRRDRVATPCSRRTCSAAAASRSETPAVCTRQVQRRLRGATMQTERWQVMRRRTHDEASPRSYSLAFAVEMFHVKFLITSTSNRRRWDRMLECRDVIGREPE